MWNKMKCIKTLKKFICSVRSLNKPWHSYPYIWLRTRQKSSDRTQTQHPNKWDGQIGQSTPSLQRFCGQALASMESATSKQSATSQCLSALPGRLGSGKFVRRHTPLASLSAHPSIHLWNSGPCNHQCTPLSRVWMTAHPSREFECTPLYTSVQLWSDPVGARRHRRRAPRRSRMYWSVDQNSNDSN